MNYPATRQPEKAFKAQIPSIFETDVEYIRAYVRKFYANYEYFKILKNNEEEDERVTRQAAMYYRWFSLLLIELRTHDYPPAATHEARIGQLETILRSGEPYAQQMAVGFVYAWQRCPTPEPITEAQRARVLALMPGLEEEVPRAP